MMKLRLLTAVCLVIPICASCANPAAGLRESLSGSPEWFEARRAEITREGYPDLNSAPGSARGEASNVSWDVLKAQLDEAQKTLAQHEKAAASEIQPDIYQWLAEKRAEVDKGLEPY